MFSSIESVATKCMSATNPLRCASPAWSIAAVVRRGFRPQRTAPAQCGRGRIVRSLLLRPTQVARDSAIAAEDISTAVIDVEPADTERTDWEAPRFAAARRLGDHDHARARHRRQPVSSVVSDSESMSGGRSRDTNSPSASMAPSCSRRPRSAAMRVAASAITRRSHSASFSGLSIEIVERSARDRARLRRARGHVVKGASLSAKRPEPAGALDTPARGGATFGHSTREDARMVRFAPPAQHFSRGLSRLNRAEHGARWQRGVNGCCGCQIGGRVTKAKRPCFHRTFSLVARGGFEPPTFGL
jgi:hypothetical protein